MVENLTLDHLRVFVAVVEEGSFSAAGRRLHRVQSAISYGISQIEGVIGFALFDRGSRLPRLTPEGKELFLEARRVLEQVEHFHERAMQMAGGLEPEVSLVLDAFFPMPALVWLLRLFSETYPTVSLRLRIEALGSTWGSVLEGQSQIGIALADSLRNESLKIVPFAEITLLPVVSPRHPLAALQRPLRLPDVRGELQIVVSDRSKLTDGRDFGVLSERTWRVADLHTKHALLLAGLGWGNLPYHVAHDDFQAGRLQPLAFEDLPSSRKIVPLCSIVRRGEILGPAARWLLENLAAVSRSCLPALKGDTSPCPHASEETEAQRAAFGSPSEERAVR